MRLLHFAAAPFQPAARPGPTCHLWPYTALLTFKQHSEAFIRSHTLHTLRQLTLQRQPRRTDFFLTRRALTTGEPVGPAARLPFRETLDCGQRTRGDPDAYGLHGSQFGSGTELVPADESRRLILCCRLVLSARRRDVIRIGCDRIRSGPNPVEGCPHARRLGASRQRIPAASGWQFGRCGHLAGRHGGRWPGQ